MNKSFALTDYEHMIKRIMSRSPFVVDVNIDGHEFHLYNLTAGCDWSEGTRKGGYIVGFHFQVMYASRHFRSRSYGVNEFLTAFPTYERFIDHINEIFTKYMKAPDFRPLAYEYAQLKIC